jgi:hypothetical protein
VAQPHELERRSQELQATFEDLLGSRNVYYNPPASVKMKYDAIVFSRSNIGNTFANNLVYRQLHRYQVTVITYDPDAEIISKISRLPMCTFDRHFVSDDLHHNVFTLYF